jgi:2-keto-4-pentenoate hydratase
MTAIAEALIAAHRTLVPIEAPYEALAPKTREEAYAVQDEVWQAVCGANRPTAFKVMIPAPGAEPMAAPMFAPYLVQSGALLPAARFRLVGVETELCVRFGKSLPARATPYSRDEILDAVASAHVGVEIVDTRLADRAAAGELWRLADSLVNGGFVIGDGIANWREIDTPQVVARSFANGEQIAEVKGKHPTGEPYFLLPWWANTGSQRFGGIHAGDLVTLGSWTGMQLVSKPAQIRGELEGIGEANVSVA